MAGGVGTAAISAVPVAAGADGTRGATLVEQLGIGGGSEAAALAPDLARLEADALATFLDRPALDAKARMLVAVAGLCVQGSSPNQLKRYMAAMLRTGWSPDAVVELAMHSLVYAGFPFAQAATLAARDLFRESGVAFRAASHRPEGDDWRLGVAELAARGDAEALEPARKVIAGEGLSPDLERWTVEFVHGEIWNRPGLAAPDRELATFTMALANGNAPRSVRRHAEACLRSGWSRDQLVEVLIQMAMLVGWPIVLNAVEPVREAFRSSEAPAARVLGADPRPLEKQSRQSVSDDVRYARGVAAMGKISGAAGEAVVNAFKDIAPDLGRYILEFSYGEIFDRPGLDLKSRELATVAALTLRGARCDETPLKVHIAGALATGASRTEIIETILHMVPYAGFTRVHAASRLAAEAFAEQDRAA